MTSPNLKIEIPPVTLIALRVFGAAIFLMMVMGVRTEKLPRDAKTWRMLLLQVVFNSIGAWTVLAWGQQFVDSGLAGVLNSTSPIFVFFITALIMQHEKQNHAPSHCIMHPTLKRLSVGSSSAI